MSTETPIDWGDLLRRQEAASAALLQERAVAPGAEQALMQARAAALAVAADLQSDDGATLECLEFTLSGESYAIEMRYVSETLPLAEFTPLFCTPPFVLGITNVRGRIISIVDLRRFFELPTIGLSDLNRVIIIGNGAVEFGVLADTIVGLTPLPARELQPPPVTCTGIREEFLTGVTRERLALLDAGKILTDRRIIVHEEAGCL